jgi:hypothetical protein
LEGKWAAALRRHHARPMPTVPQQTLPAATTPCEHHVPCQHSQQPTRMRGPPYRRPWADLLAALARPIEPAVRWRGWRWWRRKSLASEQSPSWRNLTACRPTDLAVQSPPVQPAAARRPPPLPGCSTLPRAAATARRSRSRLDQPFGEGTRGDVVRVGELTSQSESLRAE